MPKTTTSPQRDRGRLGCLGRLLILVLGTTACYWLLFAPIDEGGAQSQGGVEVDGQLTETQQAALDTLTQISAEPPTVLAEEGAVRFLTGSVVISDTIAISPQEKATYFLKQNSDLFQLGDAGKNLRTEGTTTDDLGNTFVRYSQQYKGVPVYSSDIIVSVNGQDAIDSVNAGYVPNLAIGVLPALRSTKAEEIALADLAAVDGQIVAETSLVIYDPVVWGEPSPNGPRLAWLVVVASKSNISSQIYLIDTQTGDILGRFPEMLAALNREVWNAGGVTDPLSISLFAEKLRDENGPINGATLNEDVNMAWEHAARVYDYYWNTFQRDSYDDKGGTVKLYVNFGDKCLNSAWSAIFKSAYFCPGMAQSIDIVAHELTHGVFTSKYNGFKSTTVLILWDEPAALNESYGDVFAAMIDNTEPWRITGRYRDSKGQFVDVEIRNLVDPSAKGYPDHLSKRIKPGHSLCPSKGPLDLNPEKLAGCPHANSTIPSYAAYLLAEGGESDDVRVEGITRQKMQYIYYDVIAHRLTLTSNFKQARQATIEACQSFIGQHGIVTDDCDQVKNAFAAVGIGKPANAESSGGPLDWLQKLTRDVLQALQIWARAQVDEWMGNIRQQIEAKLQEFIKWLEDLARQGIERLIQALVQAFVNWLVDFFNSLCATAFVPVGGPMVVFAIWWRRRRVR